MPLKKSMAMQRKTIDPRDFTTDICTGRSREQGYHIFKYLRKRKRRSRGDRRAQLCQAQVLRRGPIIKAAGTGPEAMAWKMALAIVVVRVMPTRLKEGVSNRK